MNYALVVVGKEARSGVKGNPISIEAGTRFLVTNERDGWVDATSERFQGVFPIRTKIFTSKQEATAFAIKWKGHPWWCIPNGEIEVIPITPRYIKSMVGYELCADVVELEESIDNNK